MIKGPFVVFFEKSKKVKDGFSDLKSAQEFAQKNEKNQKQKLIAMPVNEYKLNYLNETPKEMSTKITISELKNIIKETIEALNEEAGLTRKFDDVISQYKSLMVEKQDLVKDFVKKIKSAKDFQTADKLKKEYIRKLKSINARIKSYELKFEKSIKNLPDPDEDELL